VRALAAAALLGGLALVATGCGGSSKAGGAAGKRTIVLTMASAIRGGQPEQLTGFASEVERRSGGTIRIEFKDNWRTGDLHQEVDTIADVKRGKVDLAWVGARAWDWLGVRSFEPLVAPLLITSYPLEQEVFERRIPQRMLAGLGHAGVVGLGVLPGPMRRVLGVRRPLLRPTDFRGLRFGVQGLLAAETLSALGASPHQFFAQEPLTGLDGTEEQLSAIMGNDHDSAARYLTVNLSLWPRPLVIFAGRKLYRSLTAAQQSALRDAAKATVPQALVASRQEDGAAADVLCARGKVSFVAQTPAQLEELRRAVEPVYARIERDPATRSVVARIETLKRAIPPPATPRCARRATSSSRGTASALEGAWAMTVSRSDLLHNPAYGHPPTNEDLQLDAGKYRLVVHDGRYEFSFVSAFAVSRDTGTIRTEGEIVIFHVVGGHDKGDRDWTYRWSVYRDTLTFRRPPPGYNAGPPNQMFEPWHRVGR
jgi:TRAP-type C4-dicarboxylate transport system substrate-binding protein